MKFVTVLNRNVKPGMMLNALGHMTLGMGHRLSGAPSVSVFFGDKEQVREFRKLSKESETEGSVLSDFPHTMSGGDTDNQLLVGQATSESDMEYFGACFIAKKINSDMQGFLNTCQVLSNYTSFVPEEEAAAARVMPFNGNVNNGERGKKIVMCVNHKKPLAETINATILACLQVGAKAKPAELCLLNVEDKEGGIHPNISFHPFPVLCPSKKKNKGLATAAENNEDLVSASLKDEASDPFVTVVFGATAVVEETFTRKNTRMYNIAFKEGDLVSAASLASLIGGGSKDSMGVQEKAAALLSYVSMFNTEAAGPKAEVEQIIDKAEDLVRKPLTAEAIDQEFMKVAGLLKGAESKVMQGMASRLCFEAAGSGQLGTVEHIMKNYPDTFTADDLYQFSEYAGANGHTSVVGFLTEKAAGMQPAAMMIQ